MLLERRQGRAPGVAFSASKYDGVAKSPPYVVTAFFQDLDHPDGGLHP